jgi:pimeloyl-ACP methyl ester carboxylesterase
VAVWDALGIARSHMLGLSLGSMTGIGLALSHSNRIDRLVAADSSTDAPPVFVEMWTKRLQAMRESGMPAVAEATLPIWFSEATRASRPEIVEAARVKIVGTSAPAMSARRRRSTSADLPRSAVQRSSLWERRTARIRLRCAACRNSSAAQSSSSLPMPRT